MLTPNQVIPFLTHGDPIVRDAAIDYFRESSDFGDLTAEHGWAVIDRLGDCEQSVMMAAQMADWPQTDASISRLVAALQFDTPERLEYRYQRMVEQLDLDTLLRHRDALLAVPTLAPHVREQSQMRLATLEVPAQAVWETLMRHGVALGEEDDTLMTAKEVDAAIEAVARGGSAICDQAIAIVADHSIEDWRPIFATRVLGQARYTPAIDALVRTYTIDADYLLETTTRALARIGTLDVVRAIEAFYPGKLWFTRLYAHGPLGHIKLQESQAALVRWIDADDAYSKEVEAGKAGQNDPESMPLTVSLLVELCELGSLAGLERMRALWKADPADREVLGLLESSLGIAAMRGVMLPEESEWRQRIEADRTRYPLVVNLREAAEDKTFRDRWRATGEELDPMDLFPRPPERSAREMLPDRAVMQPIRNAEPKVGRNDPCPCGSGKKYKKCCLAK